MKVEADGIEKERCPCPMGQREARCMAREIPSPILSSRHSDGYKRGSMMQEDLCIVFSVTGSKQQLPLAKRKQRLGAILVELTVLISTTN
jgi:hypothetical protein